jgi:hypothetical protein
MPSKSVGVVAVVQGSFHESDARLGSLTLGRGTATEKLETEDAAHDERDAADARDG